METITLEQHPTEELLERYAAGRLPEGTVAAVSTHLFECDSCYERYENEVTLLSLKHAPESVVVEPQRVPFWSRIRVSFPAPVLAAAAAVALLMVVAIPKWTSHDGSPVVAELSAMRGSATASSVPAGRPVQLKLNVSGAATGEQLTVQVADSAGNSLWNGTTKPANGFAEVTVDRRLGAGEYWVRLYRPDEAEPLREYSLSLR